jgi:hypothetical protein
MKIQTRIETGLAGINHNETPVRRIMLSFPKLINRKRGKMLMVTSVLLALFPAIAVVTPVSQAQEWDHLNGRDKVNDPTGAWIVSTSFNGVASGFFLMVFHKGGTLTGNRQGENGFDPAAVPLPLSDPDSINNVISSPPNGVWQKTGWNTFAATFVTVEYHISTNPASFGSPLFRFDEVQLTGRLTESGDGMTFNAVLTFFDEKGNQMEPKDGVPFNANGSRIPLKILPNIAHSLPVPSAP